ncbi:HAMP domain-containing histidine kinase [Colwellia sp. D2M02]|uniref:HAMP domain-containing sensor histidine kinase n=1 Tax=Colwellia sp. D2M02 TaxID=2841562 RepID=UPI001C081773|nr:HAMP domain-containing histidine kinase [Colwellia sp. D2M02]
MPSKLTAKQLCQSLLKKVSISKLTLLGFLLVALPLTAALLFSVSKLSDLAKQSTVSVYHVAQLTQLNNQLSDRLVSIERFASQYVVLKDTALLTTFTEQQRSFLNIIEHFLLQQQDLTLVALLKELSVESQLIKDEIQKDSDENSGNLTLDIVQRKFKILVNLKNKIKDRSNTIINEQATNIDFTAKQVNQNILNSLYTIPITLLIALIFLLLITRPLKALIRKINTLEQGNFSEKIDVQGTSEVEEIAQALEMMRKRLHALELQKSSFIRHISHELKTPLAAIREGTELIYDNSVGPLNDDQQEICDIIRGSVTRLQRLIEDLLDFNIVLDSTSLQDAEKIHLPTLIDSALALRKLDIKRKNLVIDSSGSDCDFYSNTKQISVILDNVLSNAIKFSPLGGIITIKYHSTHNNKNNLIIEITDQGPGMSNNLKDKVFDAFYQGPPPQDNQIKGSGLGLTIVKELLMRLNGFIDLSDNHTSNHDKSSLKQHGKGSCVTITLPQENKAKSTAP